MTAPVPRLRWSYDEGDDGWVLLLFEDVEGRHPREPWREKELTRVLETLRQLARELTPSPLPLVSAGDRFERGICGWRSLQQEPPAALDDWSRRHLNALATLEAAAPAAVAGNTLLHFDMRADNLLLTPERVFLVDWPHAGVGAAWVDLVCFAPSVEMQGGPAPEDLLDRYLAGRTADPDAITAAIASLAGFFTAGALQPPPPGLPTLRAFQAAQGAVARRWLAQRTGWE
jgi:thiamine kinase-like enzyme